MLAEWFLGWHQSFGDSERDGLGWHARRLIGSLGTTDQEVRRQWLVLDWAIRVATPIWLAAAGLGDEAERLRACRPIDARQAMRDAAPVAQNAARAAQDAHELACERVARLSERDVTLAGEGASLRSVPAGALPRRMRARVGLAEGTRSAVPSLARLVRPACRAVGYDLGEPGDAPVVWQAITYAIAEAAGCVAWCATQRVVTAPAWSWSASAGDAWRMAHEAASASVRDVEDVFVASAYELVKEMFQVTHALAVPPDDVAVGSAG